MPDDDSRLRKAEELLTRLEERHVALREDFSEHRAELRGYKMWLLGMLGAVLVSIGKDLLTLLGSLPQ
jgi:hypothetical protein